MTGVTTSVKSMSILAPSDESAMNSAAPIPSVSAANVSSVRSVKGSTIQSGNPVLSRKSARAAARRGAMDASVAAPAIGSLRVWSLLSDDARKTNANMHRPTSAVAPISAHSPSPSFSAPREMRSSR